MSGPAYCGCCGGASRFTCASCRVALSAEVGCACLCADSKPASPRPLSVLDRAELIIQAAEAHPGTTLALWLDEKLQARPFDEAFSDVSSTNGSIHMTTTSEPPHGRSGQTLLPAIVRLVWDGDPDCWYVYGHVADELAVASVRDELLDELDEDEEPPELAVTHRTHARWQWPNASDDEIPGNGYTLAESAPGPGAFKVTVVRRLSDIEDDRAYQQELRERPEKSVATFKGLFPEATDARWHILGDGTVPSMGEVRARFPGLVDEVGWRFDHPDSLFPKHEDADALRAWLAERRARREAEAAEAEANATSLPAC